MGRPKGQKRCPRCGETDLAQFSRNAGRYDGLQWACKKCMTALNQTDRAHLYRRLEHYNLSVDQFDEMWAEQAGKCALCGEPLRGKFVIDHNRFCCAGQVSCGECVRGIIHPKCNNLLGQAGDSIVRLEQGILYLRTRGAQQ